MFFVLSTLATAYVIVLLLKFAGCLLLVGVEIAATPADEPAKASSAPDMTPFKCLCGCGQDAAPFKRVKGHYGDNSGVSSKGSFDFGKD
jgi:hypothetical protein